jgi:DNA-binding MarR family transcriptional regulator
MPSVPTKTKVPASHRPTDNAFRELIRVFGLVERIMQPYFAQFGISGAQWSVLRNLHRAEQEGHAGLRLTDLSERLLVRPPSVTGVVDRLEKLGLVTRDGVPEDLRAKHVVLTDKGRRILERVLAAHQGQLDAVMSGLTRAEQDDLHRLLGKLGQHLAGMLGADTN